MFQKLKKNTKQDSNKNTKPLKPPEFSISTSLGVHGTSPPRHPPPPSPPIHHPPPPHFSQNLEHYLLRGLSTFPARRTPSLPRPINNCAKAQKLQSRRLWTYALKFDCVAGFIVIILAIFQNQLIFYITPSDALQNFSPNPSKSRSTWWPCL